MRPALRLLSGFGFLLVLAVLHGIGQSTTPQSSNPMTSAQAPSSSNPAQVAPATATPAGPTAPLPPLTREDAERMALANNPRVSISHLHALAQHQVVRES